VVIGRSFFLDGVVAAAKVPTAAEGNALLLLLLLLLTLTALGGEGPMGVTNRNESNWKLSTKEEKETQLKTKNLKKRPKLVIRIALNKNQEYIYRCKSRKILL
jgi:hypothetical protein